MTQQNANASEEPVEKLQEQAEQSAPPGSAADGQQYAAEAELSELSSGAAPPTAAADPAQPDVSDLVMGGTAWLADIGSTTVHLADKPGGSGSAELAPNAQVSVIDGPQQHGGSSWWQVRTAEGQEGWVSAEQLRGQG